MIERGSYQGQDKFVIEALHGQRSGFFLDSGASNGVRGSNTIVLEEEYGWGGICVEPNGALYAELVTNRRGPCLNCCLWREETEVEFLEAAGVYGGIIDQYDAALLRYAREKAGVQDSQIPGVKKRARTILSILREFDAPKLIDYWSLDTEGSELALLQSFPFDEYGVRVITVEHNFTPARAKISEFLGSRGYQLVRKLGIDDGYMWFGNFAQASWRKPYLVPKSVR